MKSKILTRTIFVLSVMLALAAFLAVETRHSNSSNPTQRVSKFDERASDSEQAAPPNGTPNETKGTPDNSFPSNLKTFARWGGALHSAGKNGEFFFDRRAAEKFKQQAGALQRYVIRLKARSLLPLPEAAQQEVLDGHGRQAVYLQFYEHPKPDLKQRLQETGIRFQGYIDGFAWHALASKEALAKAWQLKEVRGLARIDPRDKLEPDIFLGRQPAHAKHSDGRMKYSVLGYRYQGARLDEWLSGIAEVGGETLRVPDSAWGPRYQVTCKAESIHKIAALTHTRYLQFVPPPAERRDSTLDLASNVNDVRDEGPALTGSGVTVAIREVERVKPHNDFTARFTAVDTSGNEDGVHATGVAGQVGGSGATVPTAKGVAPGCELLGYELTQETSAFFVTDIVDAATVAHPPRSVTRISNHSYGPTGEGDGSYKTESADWDEAIRDSDTGTLGNQSLLVFFASNEKTPAGFNQIDFLVGAKNTICVSAANDTAHSGDSVPETPKADGIASFSDHGPMRDGRVKPDIVANGDSVTLLSGASGSQVQSGTSFACPGVAGMAALLFEHYKNNSLPGEPSGEPSAELAKALLLNCATDLGLPGPDATYG